MTVYLVGAGPGDPGLLTRRGAEVLARADVVLFDRLVDPSLLDLAPPEATRVDVGKRPGDTHHQEDVNALLLEHARRSACVVRLKGGDPFVFGRGGEEAEVLLEAGIDVEVVPGVTAAFAAPASAGVPVTHRGLSSSVTVVTGHSGDPTAEGAFDWDALASVGGTLVIMMGMAHRAEIARRLIAAGRPPETPVLVVYRGTSPGQSDVRTTLDRLGDVGLGPPSTIVIGAVAGLDLRGAGSRPLSGRRIVVTRPRHQSRELRDRLVDAGAQVIELPVVAIADPPDGGTALRAAAERASSYDWIVFTSANAVHRFARLLRDGRSLGHACLAVVGLATAAALRAHHLVPDLVPEEATSEALVDTMPKAPLDDPEGRPGRVLFPRAVEARDVVGPGLRAKGWDVDEVDAYETVAAGPSDGVDGAKLRAASDADVLTFASPSAVAHYRRLSDGRAVPPVVACVGPVTAQAARAAGFRVDVVASDHSAEGIVAALIDHLGAGSSGPDDTVPT
jgi:uroporphyrinogen III methyltransferase/synthase